MGAFGQALPGLVRRIKTRAAANHSVGVYTMGLDAPHPFLAWLRSRPLKRAFGGNPVRKTTQDFGRNVAIIGKAPVFDERSERNIATLHPKAQAAARRFLSAAIPRLAEQGITVRIIEGSRSYAEQDALYAQGRSKPGPKVTNARGGYSLHNFGIAFDIGLFKGGTYLEESPHYRTCGPIGEMAGLEWGGRWQGLVDEPHFQLPTALTVAQMRDKVARGEAIV